MANSFHGHREKLEGYLGCGTERWEERGRQTQQVTMPIHKSVMGLGQNEEEKEHEYASVNNGQGAVTESRIQIQIQDASKKDITFVEFPTSAPQ